MDTIADLFEEQIKDLYSAETQLTRALPKMIKAAATPELIKAFTDHLKQTEEHVSRLERIADEVGFKPTGKTCAAMKGLCEEGAEAAGEDGNDSVVDGGLIAAAQRVEHYEISAYGTAKALAKVLGHTKLITTLEQTLSEEIAADKKLTAVAEESVYPNAPVSDSEESEDEGEDDEAETKAATSKATKSSSSPKRAK